MKKFCLTVLFATVFLLGANAQTIVQNDYSTPEPSADSQKTTEDDQDRLIGGINIGYYGYKKLHSVGVYDYFIRPKHLGADFGFRWTFKIDSYNIDLGPNYTFKLYGKDKIKLLLTAAIGPSLGVRDVYTYDSKGKEDSKTKVFCDMFGNARLSLVAGRFILSTGYYVWAQKFKLGKGYRGDGFNITVGYDLW